MKNFVSLKNALLGGASVVAVGMLMGPALAQDQQMETVVVTGIRASLQSAQSIKQNSDQVVDSITAVDIGALPDRNIAEALQRVPGVTLVRGDTANDLVRMGSTGQNVFIRGLSWVKSLVNGRDEFTAVSGRSLSFGDVSADLMSAVNVYKSPTASQIEGGVGGTVDLITRKPFDQDGFVMAASGDYTYGSLIDKAVPSGNFLVSDRWSGKMGEFGALFSVDWQEIVNRTEGINVSQWGCWDVANALGGGAKYYAAKDAGYGGCMALPAGASTRLTGPNGFAWRQMEFKEQRLASNLVLQWRPFDTLEFTLFAMNTFAHNQDMEHYVFSLISMSQQQAGTHNTDFNWTGGPATISSIDTRGGSGHNRNTDISLNVKYNPTERLEVTADMQYVESDSPYRNMTFYTQGRTEPNTALTGVTGDEPKLTFDDLATNSSAANYLFPFAMDHLQYNSAHAINQRIDAKYTFEGDGLFGLIKKVETGFRNEMKMSMQRGTNWNWAFIQQTWFQGGTWVGLDGTIHCNTAPCSFQSADGNTYTSASGGLQTAINQAELFHYHTMGGNSFPALWVPKTTLAQMNELQSFGIMKSYEPAPAQLASWWQPGVQSGNQWQSFAAVHGCTGDDISCLAAYNLTPGASSAGNRQSKQAEETYAGYFQLDFAADKFFGTDIPIDGNLGVRIVHTHDTISAGLLVMPFLQNSVCNVGTGAGKSSSCTDWSSAVAFLGGVSNQGTTIARPAVKNAYTNILPSFNMTLHWTDQLQSRIAYYETMLRPDFGYTYSSAQLSFNFQDSSGPDYGVFNGDPSGNGGNPYLKPMTARNFDGSLEWYFSSSGSVTVSGFYKALSNYIFTSYASTPFTNPVSGQTMNFLYTTYVNGDKGKVGGFELQYTQWYDFLPGALSGLGFQANYTKIWNSGGHNTGSDVTSPTAVAAANNKTLPLEGMSPDSYNIQLLYSKYGIDGRLAWNWRSTYMSSSSDANNKIPVWTENYGQLDASVFYSFMDHYKVGVQITNLTGSVYHTDMGFADFHPRTNWIEQDRKYAIILRTNW